MKALTADLALSNQDKARHEEALGNLRRVVFILVHWSCPFMCCVSSLVFSPCATDHKLPTRVGNLWRVSGAPLLLFVI